MLDTYLSLIIPVFNEEKRIGATLLCVDKHLSNRKYGYEIIVISDGSFDKTVDVVKKYKQLVKNLDVIDNLENNGKGAAVKLGMLAAKGKYRIFMEADNSISIQNFDSMERLFEKGCDMVIGIRDKRDSKDIKHGSSEPLFLGILRGIPNIFIQILGVSGFRDTQCGFKGFTEEAVRHIFSRVKIPRWGFDAEILAVAQRLDLKIGVIPIQWKNNQRSHVSFGGYLGMFREILLIRWNLWRNKYDIKIKDSSFAKASEGKKK